MRLGCIRDGGYQIKQHLFRDVLLQDIIGQEGLNLSEKIIIILFSIFFTIHLLLAD